MVLFRSTRQWCVPCNSGEFVGQTSETSPEYQHEVAGLSWIQPSVRPLKRPFQHSDVPHREAEDEDDNKDGDAHPQSDTGSSRQGFH